MFSGTVIPSPSKVSKVLESKNSFKTAQTLMIKESWSLKHQQPLTEWNTITSQKIWILWNTTVRTSNLSPQNIIGFPWKPCKHDTSDVNHSLSHTTPREDSKSWEPHLLMCWIWCHHNTFTAAVILKMRQVVVKLLCYKWHERTQRM